MYEYNAKVYDVTDGDTVKAYVDLGFNLHAKLVLRLYGINAPETRTKDLDEKKEGFKAKDRVIKLLEKSDYKIRMKSHGVDKYGRSLAEIIVNVPLSGEININQLLLNEGLAEEYMK